MRRSLRIAAVAALVVAAPRLALACSVCMSGRDDETRLAFLLTTAFLTVLPLLLLGIGVWWLRRRVRELERRGQLEPLRAPVLSRTASSR